MIFGPRVALVLALGICCVPALARGRAVLLPLTFQSWGQSVKTSACFQVNEQTYPQSADGKWRGFGSNAGPAEKAFDEVIAAIVKKDRDALLRLSDPGLGRDSKQFEQQSSAYFKQFETVKVIGAPYSFSFGPYTVIFAKLQLPARQLLAPFVFHKWAEGEFGFLPARTNELAFRLLMDWFEAPWGPEFSQQPAHCATASPRDFTYRVPIFSSDAGPRSDVYLNGAPLSNPGALKALAEQVETAVGQMKRSLNTENWVPAFSLHMDQRGAERLEKWFSEADPEEKAQYRKAMVDQTPFFVFDALPIAVVYTMTPEKTVQVMYFTIAPGKGAVWTNSSYATVADRLFKAGPLFESAALPKPFSSMENK